MSDKTLSPVPISLLVVLNFVSTHPLFRLSRSNFSQFSSCIGACHAVLCCFFFLSGADPVAVYRWSIVRSFFKAVHAFKMAGRQHRLSKKKIIANAPVKKKKLKRYFDTTDRRFC